MHPTTTARQLGAQLAQANLPQADAIRRITDNYPTGGQAGLWRIAFVRYIETASIDAIAGEE